MHFAFLENFLTSKKWEHFWIPIFTPFLAISLHKTFNEIDPHLKTETIRLFEQIICSRRQINFELFRNNVYKIGMNT